MHHWNFTGAKQSGFGGESGNLLANLFWVAGFSFSLLAGKQLKAAEEGALRVSPV